MQSEYELYTWPHNPAKNFTLKTFFGIFKITRNADKSKFAHNGRGTAFHGGVCNFENNSARKIVLFGVNDSSSSHTDN